MNNNFHVDMSGRIYENRTIGIALVGTETKENYGCVLKGNLIKLIKKNLFIKNIYEDSAKLYAICIFLLVKKVKNNIHTLIICNDEDFEAVKKVLLKLLRDCNFETSRCLCNLSTSVWSEHLDSAQEPEHARDFGPRVLDIISISEFRKRLGRNVGSLADNYANIYRKRGLKPNKLSKGRELNVVEVTYKIIKGYWEELA